MVDSLLINSPHYHNQDFSLAIAVFCGRILLSTAVSDDEKLCQKHDQYVVDWVKFNILLAR